MCNKCSNYHQGLLDSHHQINLDKNNPEIFINICKEKEHPLKLEYYCKNHNILCCAACISKIEGKGNGKHKDCNICFIEEIKDEKKRNLKDNMIFLEKLSNDLENKINELKIVFEKINKNKEELKEIIQKTFTKIRTILNEREDILLSEVDNKFSELYFNDNFAKDIEKLPSRIKKALENGKNIDNKWNDENRLSEIIYDCNNIENSIKDINLITSNLKKYNLNNNITKIKFLPRDTALNNFLLNIKKFGDIYINKFNNINSLNSIILKDNEDYYNFYEILSERIKINNIRLIFSSTKDGLSYQSIVKNVYNKSNLIFLFLTGGQRIFGAYISTQLNNIQPNKLIKDENSLVFSLNNNKIYKILVPESFIKILSTIYNIDRK